MNAGQKETAIRNLDLLATQLDTTSYTREDILVISELYKAAGASSKAERFDTKASSMGVELPARSTTISKAVRRVN